MLGRSRTRGRVDLIARGKPRERNRHVLTVLPHIEFLHSFLSLLPRALSFSLLFPSSSCHFHRCFSRLSLSLSLSFSLSSATFSSLPTESSPSCASSPSCVSSLNKVELVNLLASLIKAQKGRRFAATICIMRRGSGRRTASASDVMTDLRRPRR